MIKQISRTLMRLGDVLRKLSVVGREKAGNPVGCLGVVC